MQCCFQTQKIATSSSKEKNTPHYQPGGTLTLALGKWASRVIARGRDELLGRWSYLELVGQQGKHIMLLSAYRVCTQQFDATANTVTAQQTRLLQQQGIKTPNPKKQFVTNLIALIKTWIHAGKDILLGMDANEDVDNPHSHITQLFTETRLIDLHNHRHPTLRKPATHNHGSAPIDIMAGTQLLADAIHYAWILPFGMPALIKGDHRLLGIDFDPDILFGTKPATPAPSLLCGVNSNNELHIKKFCTTAIEQCTRHNLGDRIDALMHLPMLHETDIRELELIDSTLTKILTHADQSCRSISNIPWSPTVQKAYIKHQYWTLRLAEFCTERNLSSSLDSLAARLAPEDTYKDPTKSLSAHLKIAQKQLHAARREAAQLWKRHLEEILNQAKAANLSKKSKVVTYLIRAEQNRRCYARYRHHTKLRTSFCCCT